MVPDFMCDVDQHTVLWQLVGDEDFALLGSIPIAIGLAAEAVFSVRIDQSRVIDQPDRNRAQSQSRKAPAGKTLHLIRFSHFSPHRAVSIQLD